MPERNRFVQFTRSEDATPVSVNPEYVAKIEPLADDPNGTTVICLKDGEKIGVNAAYSDVLNLLERD